MKLSIVSSLADIAPQHWNKLTGKKNPFIQYEFLHALEQHNCLQPWGWYPRYLLVHDNNELVGATPTYIKTNSYGEFVFDWAWADAYQRHSLNYYPKLVTSIPYTPAKGPRLLTLDGHDSSSIRQLLIEGAVKLVHDEQLSSAHWLFCESEDMVALKKKDMLIRFDYQFHWQNNDYENFDHYLAKLSSKKRKNINRERRKVKEAGVTVEVISGNDLNDEQWKTLYQFYALTFHRKHGEATLTYDFFRATAHWLRAIFACHDNKIVAGAICYQGEDTLYGRHWGCYEKFDSLHFEVCYYTGIDYCINNNIQYFEPGAQGEHKIARGFLPVKTHSAHWIKHEAFRDAIAHHLKQEHNAMDFHGKLLADASPFRKTG